MSLDHSKYVTDYLANIRSTGSPTNDATAYGVEIVEADVAEGETYWRVIGVHHLRPEENRGKHNIYLEARDETGLRIRDPRVSVGFSWEGQQPHEHPAPAVLDKPDAEPMGDIAVEKGQKMTIWALGLPKSDRVRNLHTEHADEELPPPEEGTGNQRWHHSFYVVFQRTLKRAGGNGGGPEIDEPVTPPETTVTLSGQVTSASGEPIRDASLRLIGTHQTAGASRHGAAVVPAALTWTRKVTGFSGHRWSCWNKYVAREVSGITWEEFKELALVYNPSLKTTNYVLEPDRVYVLPENQFLSASIVWDRPLTGFSGNSWECWKQFVEKKVVGMAWPTFSTEVVMHNPKLAEDDFVFKAEKTYLLPRSEGLEEYEIFTASRASGGYKFEEVPVGQYRLDVKADYHHPVIETVDLGQDTVHDVELEPLVVEGDVSFDVSDAFVGLRGDEFVLGGQTLRFIGVNIRGLVHYGDGQTLPHAPADHRLIQLRAARDMGARVVRVFLASRHASPEDVENRLRAVIDILKSDEFKGVDMCLLLAFTNLYNDVPFFVQGDDEFYQPGDVLNKTFFETGFKQNYLRVVERVVKAFKNEPRIFAYEIGNELKLDRANMHDPNDPNPSIFINFIQAVAAQIREWDEDNHLITTGMISTRHAWLFDESLKRDLYDSPHLDFLTIHAYQGENLEDDSPLAKALNKPFIVEEAGFDAQHGEDRTQSVAEDMDKWFGRGASGYTQWGFMATPDNGDGDRMSGMDRVFHSDWDNLFNLYRQRAEALRNV